MLTDLYNALLQFFELSPNGTREQFVSAVVAREIADAGQAGQFCDAFVASAIDLMVLPAGSDFAAMMAAARAVTLERAAYAAGRIFEEVQGRAEYLLLRLQVERAALVTEIARLERIRANGQAGYAWLVANGPDGAVKDDTLELIQLGGDSLDAQLAWAQRRLVALDDEIEGLS